MAGAILEEIEGAIPLTALARRVCARPGGVALLTGSGQQGRFSIFGGPPMLILSVKGAYCEMRVGRKVMRRFGNPWETIRETLGRYESLEDGDAPIPLGGCFGYWGYDLKNAVEPSGPGRAFDDLESPDAFLAFCPSLLVFDHERERATIVATGLNAEGERSLEAARGQRDAWRRELDTLHVGGAEREREIGDYGRLRSTLSKNDFMGAVERAQAYIGQGHIYQVNLSHRLSLPWSAGGGALFEEMLHQSPAPFAGMVQTGDFQVVSSSPERFLRISGREIETVPIKGTRPRSADPVQDRLWAEELVKCPKERSELVMITDLLRNDLGRVCDFGTVEVPRLLEHEAYPHVHHLVSEVRGRLRGGLSHVDALRACFPGGSVTGAPKIRSIEIIDALEPTTRGPYTGCLGYLGFNRQSQLSILIRTAMVSEGWAHFPVGAGIVSDSDPESEYRETLVKARGFFDAVGVPNGGFPENVPKGAIRDFLRC